MSLIAPLAKSPFLASEEVRSDGGERLRLRLFCPRTGATTPAQTCETCVFAVEIHHTDERSGWVDCAAAAEGAATGESAGGAEGAPCTVASIALEAAPSVDSGVDQRTVRRLLASPRVRIIAVVDANEACVGWIRPSGYLAGANERAPIATAGELMSSAVTIDEDTLVEVALRQMACSRLRELLIVTHDGRPVALLTDVDALRHLGRMHAR